MSTAADGTMKNDAPDVTVRENRHRFLLRHSISADTTKLVVVTYGGDDYARYIVVEDADNIPSDSVFTLIPGTPLFLPLADCIGAVLYDTKNNALGMAHLGRHNLVQSGGTKNIEYMQQTFGSHPKDITVFMSPAASKTAYPLHDFDGKSLHDVAVEQLLHAGIVIQNITIDERDTTTDESLFSHSNFLQGKQETDGRHALVAIVR